MKSQVDTFLAMVLHVQRVAASGEAQLLVPLVCLSVYIYITLRWAAPGRRSTPSPDTLPLSSDIGTCKTVRTRLALAVGRRVAASGEAQVAVYLPSQYRCMVCSKPFTTHAATLRCRCCTQSSGRGHSWSNVGRWSNRGQRRRSPRLIVIGATKRVKHLLPDSHKFRWFAPMW